MAANAASLTIEACIDSLLLFLQDPKGPQGKDLYKIRIFIQDAPGGGGVGKMLLGREVIISTLQFSDR